MCVEYVQTTVYWVAIIHVTKKYDFISFELNSPVTDKWILLYVGRLHDMLLHANGKVTH